MRRHRCDSTRQAKVLAGLYDSLDRLLLRGNEGTTEHHVLLYLIEDVRRWHLPVEPTPHDFNPFPGSEKARRFQPVREASGDGPTSSRLRFMFHEGRKA